MSELLKIAFGEVAFKEAIEGLRKLVPMADAEFDEIERNAQTQAFTFAGATLQEAAGAVQRVLEGVMRGDIPRDQALDRANEALEPFGLSVSSHQMRTILETNMATFFDDGTWKQFQNPEFSARFPYVGLSTAHDNRVRPNHFALDYRRIKTVFPMQDFLWTVMRPPLGYRCRCNLLAFAADELEERGLAIGSGQDWYGRTVTVALPGGKTSTAVIMPDKGFGSGRLVGKCDCKSNPIIDLALALTALAHTQRRAA